MKIEGPISISILDDDVQQKRTLEINFKNEFQKLELSSQLSELKKYIQSLFQHAQSLQDGQADKEGILLVMQICEQLLPFLKQQELDLSETIAFEMGLSSTQSEIAVSLTDLKLN